MKQSSESTRPLSCLPWCRPAAARTYIPSLPTLTFVCVFGLHVLAWMPQCVRTKLDLLFNCFLCCLMLSTGLKCHLRLLLKKKSNMVARICFLYLNFFLLDGITRFGILQVEELCDYFYSHWWLIFNLILYKYLTIRFGQDSCRWFNVKQGEPVMNGFQFGCYFCAALSFSFTFIQWNPAGRIAISRETVHAEINWSFSKLTTSVQHTIWADFKICSLRAMIARAIGVSASNRKRPNCLERYMESKQMIKFPNLLYSMADFPAIKKPI